MTTERDQIVPWSEAQPGDLVLYEAQLHEVTDRTPDAIRPDIFATFRLSGARRPQTILLTDLTAIRRYTEGN